MVVSAASFLILPQKPKGAANPGGVAFVAGYYGGEPRDANGTVNASELLRLCKKAGGNTHNMPIMDPKDFAALEEFAALADKEGIYVWATVLPPSELSPEKRNDIRYVDYLGWARRIATLSLKHRSLVAWSIDNVLNDYGLFTPAYLGEIARAAREINPDLKFVPVVYYQHVASPIFEEAGRDFDGVQFYYTGFPAGAPDEAAALKAQLGALRAKFSRPVIVGVYSSGVGQYQPSPEYVGQLINLARQDSDGAMIYMLQKDGRNADIARQLYGGGS